MTPRRVLWVLPVLLAAAAAAAHNGELPVQQPAPDPVKNPRDFERPPRPNSPRDDMTPRSPTDDPAGPDDLGGLPRAPGGAPEPEVPGVKPRPAPVGRDAAGRPIASGPRAGDWSVWWRLNRDRLLDLAPLRRKARAASRTGITPHFLGRAGGRNVRYDPAERARVTIAAALRAAAEDPDPDVASSALVALGKLRDAESLPLLARLAESGAVDQTVRESALLALGIAGGADPAARDVLAAALADGGRRDAERAFAALGAGLGPAVSLAPALLRAGETRESRRDAPGFALLALGLLGDEILVPDLGEKLAGANGSRERDDVLRAFVAAALGKIGSRAAIPALCRALQDGDLDVRRQAALSLGALTGPADEAATGALTRYLLAERDPAARGYAAIALGESGAPGSLDALLLLYQKGDAQEAPYAALALGLLARRCGTPGVVEAVRSTLRDELSRRGQEDLRGALAIGVALAGDPASAPLLRRLVLESGPAILRGHYALALGILLDEPARGPLRAAMAEKGEPVLREEAAYALGLLGDRAGLEDLVAVVRSGDPDYRRGSAALSLGHLMEPEDASALLDLLSDGRETDGMRAVAAMALGRIGERDVPPALSRFTSHLNPLLPVESLREALALF